VHLYNLSRSRSQLADTPEMIIAQDKTPESVEKIIVSLGKESGEMPKFLTNWVSHFTVQETKSWRKAIMVRY